MGFSSSTFVAAYGPSDHIIKFKDTAGNRVGGFHVCQYVKSATEDKELWILTALGKIILDFATPQEAQAALNTIEVAVDALLPNCSDSGAPQPYIPLSGTTLTHALTGPIEYSTITNETSVFYSTSANTTFAIGGGDDADLINTAVKAAYIKFNGNHTHYNSAQIVAKEIAQESFVTVQSRSASLQYQSLTTSSFANVQASINGVLMDATDSSGALNNSFQILTSNTRFNSTLNFFGPQINNTALSTADGTAFYVGSGDSMDLAAATIYGSILYDSAGAVTIKAISASPFTTAITLDANGGQSIVSQVLGGGSETDITQTNTFIQVYSDYASFAGVTYQADYSANFTARSLIDKGYADATYLAAGAAFIPLTGTVAPLTGTIVYSPSAGQTTLFVNSAQNGTAPYFIGGGDNADLSAATNYARIMFDGATPNMILKQGYNTGAFAQLQLGNSFGGHSASFTTNDNAGISVSQNYQTNGGWSLNLRNANITNQQLAIQLDCSAAPFTFFVSQFGSGFQGIQYGFDYSADYTTRSLIDKGYADATYSKKAAVTFTPGAINTPNTITHSLNSTDIVVQLWDVTTGAVILADIDNVTSTQVDITFSANPAGDVKVVVLG